jgi:hypothetical protein
MMRTEDGETTLFVEPPTAGALVVCVSGSGRREAWPPSRGRSSMHSGAPIRCVAVDMQGGTV